MYLGMRAWATLLICDAVEAHTVAQSCVELIPNYYLMNKAQLLLNTQAARFDMKLLVHALISQNP